MEFEGMLHNLYKYTGNTAVFTLGITVVLGAINFNKLNKSLQRLFYFLIWNLVIEVLARAFAYSGISNLPLLHLYTLGEFILFSWFYKSLISKPKFFMKWFWPFTIVGALLIAINSIFFLGINDHNPLAKTIVQVIIISYAVLYFYNLTDDKSHSRIDGKSLRLINSAILIYYSGSLFIFMCSQMLIAYLEWMKIFWTFNAALNLIFQLLILWGIWIVIFRKTKLPS